LNQIIKKKDQRVSILVDRIILARLEDYPDELSQIVQDLSEIEPAAKY
jgi:hypothetical protein